MQLAMPAHWRTWQTYRVLERLALVLLVTATTLAAVPTLWAQAQDGDAGQAAGEAAAPVPAADEQPASDDPTSDKPAEEPVRLTIGDKAPLLSVSEWVHGKPVEEFKKDHIYVVEFWATWCGPCRASMPHVSQLQEAYRDRATFVGVSNEETDVVKDFLGKPQEPEGEKTWADVLTYNLAMDKESQTTDAYMAAAQQFGIPCAFLVGREGVIEWIGHPMAMEEVLAKVDKNEWDRQAFKQQYEEEQAAEAIVRKASLAIREATRSGDWEPAIQAINEAAEKLPERPELQMARLTVLIRAERYDDLTPLLKQMRDKYWENADMLNELSWALTTRISVEHRDLDLAQEMAVRANELTKGENASIVDTLARIKFERGEIKEAVELQKKAIELEPAIEQLKQTLKEYEAALNEDKESAEPEDEPAPAEDKEAK